MGINHSIAKKIIPAHHTAAPVTPADTKAANTTPPCVQKRPWDECIPTGVTKLATTITRDPTTGRDITTTTPVMIYRAPDRDSELEMMKVWD